MSKDDPEELDDIVEEAISKKRNVKDILIEMKNTSELMIDLAYSALLCNSQKIAEEVSELEREMDDLQYEIETMLLLAARTPEEAADLTGILHVARASEQIADAADDIVDIVRRGVGDHPIYASFLDETEDQITRVIIAKGSGLAGKSLGTLKLWSTVGAYVRGIRRGKKWIYYPGKNTKLREGDVVIASGTGDAVDCLEKLAGSGGPTCGME